MQLYKGQTRAKPHGSALLQPRRTTHAILFPITTTSLYEYTREGMFGKERVFVQ